MKFKSNYKNEYTPMLKELLQKGDLVEAEDGFFIPYHKEKDHQIIISIDTRNELNTFGSNKN